MKDQNTSYKWTSNHDHVFGLDKQSESERRTGIVVVLTATIMVIEIIAGIVYGSMALLADGLHMASHAVALGITAFAYRYSRQHAGDARFSFGTGKVNALAGYSGAVLLGVFALGMAAESINRFIRPVDISINHALAVAILGLIVNGVSVLILGIKSNHANHHDDSEHLQHHHHDHNFRSAYLHVLADALTSVFAIGALLSAKYFGFLWLDPVMGIVGALLVAKWSVGLLRDSGHVLLDRQAEATLLNEIRNAIENEPRSKVVDLHVWSIGPGQWAAIISVETEAPVPLNIYRSRLPQHLGLKHVTIEVSTIYSAGRNY